MYAQQHLCQSHPLSAMCCVRMIELLMQPLVTQLDHVSKTTGSCNEAYDGEGVALGLNLLLSLNLRRIPMLRND